LEKAIGAKPDQCTSAQHQSEAPLLLVSFFLPSHPSMPSAMRTTPIFWRAFAKGSCGGARDAKMVEAWLKRDCHHLCLAPQFTFMAVAFDLVNLHLGAHGMRTKTKILATMACHGPKRNAWHDQEVKECPHIPPEQISVWHVWSTHNCWSPSAHGAMEFLLHAKILAQVWGAACAFHAVERNDFLDAVW
jgi:hypothetical protein